MNFSCERGWAFDFRDPIRPHLSSVNMKLSKFNNFPLTRPRSVAADTDGRAWQMQACSLAPEMSQIAGSPGTGELMSLQVKR